MIIRHLSRSTVTLSLLVPLCMACEPSETIKSPDDGQVGDGDSDGGDGGDSEQAVSGGSENDESGGEGGMSAAGGDPASTGGAGGATNDFDCSELTVDACADFAPRDDDPLERGCRLITLWALTEESEGTNCREPELHRCVDIQGPNCGDTDSQALWIDEEGNLWLTSDGCGLPDFEPFDGSAGWGDSCLKNP